MREATIILPVLDNRGHSLDHIHSDLQAALCNVFSGYTATAGKGGWQSADGRIEEPVTVYTIAMDDSEANTAVLTEIANDIGRKARQEAVYVRYPNGNVDILPTRDLVAA